MRTSRTIVNEQTFNREPQNKVMSTSEVLDRHLQSFAERDVDGVLADYSSDAVLFAPGGPLKGPEAIKPLFESLISEFAKPGSSFTLQLRSIEGDHAYILWTAETADNWYEFATDTFVVRNGKIVAQSFAAKIKPKN
jgi:ketosteroid isomerase-like protein